MADDKESVVPQRNITQDKISNKRKKRSRTIAGDGFSDIQFENAPVKVPYKAIIFAVGLLVVGSLLIIFGALLITGLIYIENSSQTWPLILVGSLMLIPGVYYVRMACYAYKGHDGFSYENMPEFE